MDEPGGLFFINLPFGSLGPVFSKSVCMS